MSNSEEQKISQFLFAISFLAIFCILLSLVYTWLDYGYEIGNIKLFSPYECGFIPYNTSLTSLDINFSAVAILFIIFDIETVLILPYVVDFELLDNVTSLFYILLFIMLFVLGMGYEVKSEIIII